jgi:hypothetical protein
VQVGVRVWSGEAETAVAGKVSGAGSLAGAK